MQLGERDRLKAVKPIRVLFEDEDLIAVSKPIGLVVDAGDERTTDGAEDLISALEATGRKVFPYHRLDRDTSGIVLLGKSRRISRDVTKLFEEKRIRKSYLAVVEGLWPKALNKVELKIGEKDAVTTFRVLRAHSHTTSYEAPIGIDQTRMDRTWLEALPKTGRKHQIRLHCADSGHPILGDAVYGKKDGAGDSGKKSAWDNGVGHALHAYKLEFKHPRTKTMLTIVDPPESWKATWLAQMEIGVTWAKLFNAHEASLSGEDKQ